MKRDKQKTNWGIDLALFAGFLGALWLDLTGVVGHQVLGLAVAALSGYHLWKHWAWVDAVSSRFFGRTSGKSRTYYLIDSGLAAGLGIITVTGLVISTWLSLSLANYAAWHTVHVAASVGTLGLLLVKIGFHWRWVVDIARRKVFASKPEPATPARVTVASPAVPALAPLGRRDFVKLMAGVGAVALVSGVNAFGALKIDEVDAAGASQAAGTTATAGTAQTVTAASVAASSCTVRCGRGCSYPGHCGRYTDSNNNGRCDLGECLS